MFCSLSTEGVEPLVKLLKKAKLSDLSLYMNDLGNPGIVKVRFQKLKIES